MARLTALVVALFAVVVPPAEAARWARPVAGAVTRPFVIHGSPFAAGQHRGVDLAAPPGALVGAPCGGRVVVAARIGTSRGVVTVACGPWRASVLPLARIGVRRGEVVRAGEPVGTGDVTAAHAGIHLGVRRANDPFGYVDPMRFLPRGQAPPLGPAQPPARRTPRREPAPSWRPHAAPHDVVALVPWPAWAGAALIVTAAAGGVTLRRRARTPRGRLSALERRPVGAG